jgi:methyl-accepting chemotaxis protein
MSRLAELGIAKRLGLMVLGGVIALVALAIIAVTGQRTLEQQADDRASARGRPRCDQPLDTQAERAEGGRVPGGPRPGRARDTADDVQASTEAATP